MTDSQEKIFMYSPTYYQKYMNTYKYKVCSSLLLVCFFLCSRFIYNSFQGNSRGETVILRENERGQPS